MFRERAPAAAQPWGSRTVSVAAPSKARKRNVPAGPVWTLWVRSPCASITCACAAPAPPGSPTLPSTIGARAAASSAQRRRLTASVCPSQDHIARILLAAGHLRKSSIFPHDLAGISAHGPWDSNALVVPHARGPRVVGHQGLVAAREPALEPAEVADGEAHVDHRILAHRRAFADVGLATRDPREGGRSELHQPVSAPLAGHVRPEAAFHRYQAQEEEGIVAGPCGLTEDRLGQLRPELRFERPCDPPEKRFQVRLAHRPWILRLGVAGEGGRQAEEGHEGARQAEPDAHGPNGDPGASSGHAPPGRGPPADPPRPWRLTTGRFERQGAEQAKCTSEYGDTGWKLPVSPRLAARPRASVRLRRRSRIRGARLGGATDGDLLQLLAELLQLDPQRGELLARSPGRGRQEDLELCLGAIAQRLQHLARLLLELARSCSGPGLRLLECLVELRLELAHRPSRFVSQCVIKAARAYNARRRIVKLAAREYSLA